MVQVVLNEDHLSDALGRALESCRRRLFIATANVKDLHVPTGVGCHASPSSGEACFRRQQRRGSMAPNARRGRRTARSILELLAELAEAGIEVRLLHSGVPSGPVLQRLREGLPAGLVMRRCPRVHAKAVIADGRWMYLGSANLTGAGLGAKSERRRNFEAGIWTDDQKLIDPVADMLDEVWSGACCGDCGRKEHCPEPLEEPSL